MKPVITCQSLSPLLLSALLMVPPTLLADSDTAEDKVDEALIKSAVDDARAEQVPAEGDAGAAEGSEPGEASYNVENCEALIEAGSDGVDAGSEVESLDLDKCRQLVK